MTASVVAIAIAIDEDDEISRYRRVAQALGSVEGLVGVHLAPNYHHGALDLCIG